jgi:hypothetical protein
MNSSVIYHPTAGTRRTGPGSHHNPSSTAIRCRRMRASRGGRACAATCMIPRSWAGSGQHSGTPQPPCGSHSRRIGSRTNRDHESRAWATAPGQKRSRSSRTMTATPLGDNPGMDRTGWSDNGRCQTSARTRAGDLRPMAHSSKEHVHQCLTLLDHASHLVHGAVIGRATGDLRPHPMPRGAA